MRQSFVPLTTLAAAVVFAAAQVTPADAFMNRGTVNGDTSSGCDVSWTAEALATLGNKTGDPALDNDLIGYDNAGSSDIGEIMAVLPQMGSQGVFELHAALTPMTDYDPTVSNLGLFLQIGSVQAIHGEVTLDLPDVPTVRPWSFMVEDDRDFPRMAGRTEPMVNPGTFTMTGTNTGVATLPANGVTGFGGYAWVPVTYKTPTVIRATFKGKVASCKTGSAVRGDYNEDGRADILMAGADGTVSTSYVLPGRGGGDQASPVDVLATKPKHLTGDFHTPDWVNSPGDLNGDGHQDALMRSGNGDLVAYLGDGSGTFPTQNVVGVGWGEMDPNKLFALSNFLNGRTSILAVNTTNCFLYRYDFDTVGMIAGSAIIGNGWCGMRQILSPAPNTIAGITTTGDYLLYSGAGAGTITLGPAKVGNGWNFTKVTSPGDLTKRGYADVLAVDTAGLVRRYPTGPSGTWGAVTTPYDGLNLGNWNTTYKAMS